MNLEAFINQKYDTLNSTDKDILEFVVQNKELVKEASLSEIADKAHFSKSAVFRVCKKLGLTGFSQLRYMLQDETNPESEEVPDVDYLSQTVRSVLWTVNQFKSTKLDDVYAEVYKANNVYIYATGWMQQIMAQQLQRNLYLLGKMSFVFPAALEEMSAPQNHVTQNDMLIVISYSGMRASVIKFVETLQLQGVKVLSFTSFKQNKVAQEADYNLYYDTINKSIEYENRRERFFPNLDILIDIFCMGLINYTSAREKEEEQS
ncbi:transcriptional regulator [Lacticaseibacillus paracasei]|uniref:Transcriptional regulator n=1 Tax=Lacticaseibacillus paracasei TaxID=1597 RepID=A0ABD6VYP0_LACPA|nr:MurR/RpiR family transcriptional regulator [Lacticaseibacillus paracasei]POE40598.1 transcriptional regulator [Lacticaseibacillus paracasei]